MNKRTVDHPTLFGLIELLKKLQDETDHDIRTINNLTKKRQRNPKYEALDQEIRRLKGMYDDQEILRSEFLDRVAVCLSDKKV